MKYVVMNDAPLEYKSVRVKTADDLSALLEVSKSMSQSLILRGYHQVTTGRVQFMDRYWEPRLLAWLPILVNDCREVLEFCSVIRKDGN